MTTARDIQQRNQIALAQRDEIWRQNPRPGFDIKALSGMPPYLGLVDAPLSSELTVVMFLSNNDDGVALRWLWNGCYEPMSLGLWTLLARQANVIFDIGAHTGVYTLAAAMTNRKATVVSCEPYDLNYARLLINLRANGFATDTAYPIAISDRDDVVPFAVSTSFWYLSTGGSVGERSGVSAGTCQPCDSTRSTGKIPRRSLSSRSTPKDMNWRSSVAPGMSCANVDRTS